MLLLDTMRQALQQVAANIGVGMRRTGPINIDIAKEFSDGESMRTFAGLLARRQTRDTYNPTLEDDEMRRVYRKWAAEPSVKASLKGKVANLASLGLQVKPSDKKNPLAHKVAAGMRASLTGTPQGWTGLVWEIAVHGLQDGWSCCNHYYTDQQRGQFRGQRVLAGIKAKDVQFIIPLVDPYQNVIGLYNHRGNFAKRFDPAEFLIFTNDRIFQSITGFSDLRGAYRSMKMIPEVLKLRMIFLDKYSGPFLKGTLSAPALRDKMMEELARARGEGFIVLDKGSDVQAVELATRGTGEFQAALEDLRQEAVTGISGAFLHMMTGTTADARGDSGVQQKTTDLFVWLLAEQIAALINAVLVPAYVDHNYGSTVDLPIVSLEAVDPADVLNQLKIDQMLDVIGVDASAEEVLDRAARTPANGPGDSIQGLKAQRIRASGVGIIPTDNRQAMTGFSERAAADVAAWRSLVADAQARADWTAVANLSQMMPAALTGQAA